MTDFFSLSRKTLDNIVSKIEVLDTSSKLELEFNDKVIEIDLPDKRKYVINCHDIASEIWLSSPISGAYHFQFDPETLLWLDRNKNNLLDVLFKEIEKFV